MIMDIVLMVNAFVTTVSAAKVVKLKTFVATKNVMAMVLVLTTLVFVIVTNVTVGKPVMFTIPVVILIVVSTETALMENVYAIITAGQEINVMFKINVVTLIAVITVDVIQIMVCVSVMTATQVHYAKFTMIAVT